MSPQPFAVFHQIQQRVLERCAPRRAPPGAPLVQQHHAVLLRVKEPGVPWIATGARTTVQKERVQATAGTLVGGSIRSIVAIAVMDLVIERVQIVDG